LWTRQLSDLLDSGVPLLTALEVVENQTENRWMQGVSSDIRLQVKNGASLSEAMRTYPDVFSSVYTSLIRAGEVGGFIGQTLSRLSEFAEGEHELRSKVLSAMAYPLLIVIVGAGTVLFLMSFVVPKLAGMFADMGQNLPLITRILAQVSAICTSYGWVGLLLAVGSVAAFRMGKGWERGRFYFDRMLVRLPVWGTVVKKVAIARLARTLGMLLSGNVPILEALRVVSGTLNHPVLQDQLRCATQSVQEGKGLAESLKGAPDFPPFICNMIAIGEEGNSLEKSLHKVAATYERDSDRAIKLMTSLLEPLMILGVGSIIGIIVVAMLLPIFQIHTFVH